VDLITQFPLGDDIAVTLLVLAALSIAALVVGAIVPSRLRRDEDSEDVDETLGRRLGVHLASAGSIILWVGLPVLVLLYLAPGTTDARIMRSAMMLVGLLLGPLAAWRGIAVQLSVLGVPADRRPALIARLGALTVAGALAVAVLPIAIVIWFLQEGADWSLISLAGGAAISALAIRACSAPVDTAAASAAVLVGTDEHELEADDPGNLGTPHLRTARMFRRGGALSADLVAVTTALAGVGVLLGVPVLAAEGILVVLLGLGVAMLAAGVVAVIPHVGRPGHESGALRLGGLSAALLGGAGTVAAAALWLPRAYKDLRFEHAGMGSFTDPAVAGEEPLPREQLEPQIEEAVADMSQWISATDDSRDASAFLDVLTLYTVSPSAVVAGALGLGVLAALGAVLLSAGIGDRQGGTVLRAARTSRTGGALGTAAGLGSTALVAAGAVGLLVLVATVLSVLSAGVPELALALLAYSGLGALVVVAGFAASLAAPSLVEGAEVERGLRDAGTSAAIGPRVVLLLTAVLPALAVVGTVVTSLQTAPRAESVWEDRALHAVTPMSLPLLAGVALGAVTVLLVTASLLDASRRAGALAVVDTRAGMLEGHDRVLLNEMPEATRRAVLTPVVVAVLMPLVAGFGLGPAALPGLLIGVVISAAALGLWALGSATALEGAADLISTGRYGGPGSWGHSGALGGAVLTGVLRSAVGSVALPLLLSTSLLTALTVSAATGMFTDGTSMYLRWGVAVVALLVMTTCWVITATAPEVDLEDEVGAISRPLFAREEEQEGTLEAMSWEVDEEDEGRDDVVVPVQKPARRRRRGHRRAEQADQDSAQD